MAPTSRFALLGRSPTAQKDKDFQAWRPDPIVPPRDPKTMSKAERLLGVADGSGAQAQRSVSDSSKRSQKGKGFVSALSDLKGVLGGSSGSRGSSLGRRTRSSPAVRTQTTDSDSMTSMTSPTFDATGTGSTSTLPSYYEAPSSPYFSNRGSSGPSSPKDFDPRHEYHAALHSTRHKHSHGSDMPAITEIYDFPEDKETDLPPLEKAPLSPNTSSTSKRRGSFGPVTRLRSPSSTSVATESTAKGKWIGWRQSKLQGKDIILTAMPKTSGSQSSNTAVRIDLSGGSRHENAVEDWLARADLERRPSQSSKVTVPRSITSSVLSPSDSQISIKTLTTQKDAILAPPLPPITKPSLRQAKSSNDLPRKPRNNPSQHAAKPRAIHIKDLMVESVLTFSSSEDENSDGEISRPKRASKRVSIIRAANDSVELKLETPFKAVRKTPSQTLQVQQKAPRTLNYVASPPRPALRQTNSEVPPIQSPKPVRARSTRPPFATIEWQGSDGTELGNLCITSADKFYAGKPDKLVEIPSGKRTSSSSLSPTSKVMVVSKKEEKLLAYMRDRKDRPEKGTNEDSDNSPSSSNPIIQISPPRRKANRKPKEESEGMYRLDENKVLNFPAPPIASRGGSTETLALKLSTESLSDLPEVVAIEEDHPDDVSLPSILLSPSIASRMSLNYSVSDLTPSASETSTFYGIPEMPPVPSELYGSVPDLTDVLHTGLGHKNSGRSRASSAKSKIYMTGLEHHGASGDDDDLEGEDLAKYVMASCM